MSRVVLFTLWAERFAGRNFHDFRDFGPFSRKFLPSKNLNENSWKFLLKEEFAKLKFPNLRDFLILRIFLPAKLYALKVFKNVSYQLISQSNTGPNLSVYHQSATSWDSPTYFKCIPLRKYLKTNLLINISPTAKIPKSL